MREFIKFIKIIKTIYLIYPHDNVVKESAVDGLSQGVSGIAGFIGLERDHDDGTLEPALAGLHHSGCKGSPHVICKTTILKCKLFLQLS